MSERNDVLATLSPGATAMVQQLITHFDGDPTAGAFIILTRLTDQGTFVEGYHGNMSPEGMLGGAQLVCLNLIEALRRCDCGRDHNGQIAVIQRVMTLLGGTAEQLQ